MPSPYVHPDDAFQRYYRQDASGLRVLLVGSGGSIVNTTLVGGNRAIDVNVVQSVGVVSGGAGGSAGSQYLELSSGSPLVGDVVFGVVGSKVIPLQLTTGSLLKVSGEFESSINTSLDNVESYTLVSSQAVITPGNPVSKAYGLVGVLDDVGTATISSEGSTGIMRMTPYRGIHVNLRDQDGVEVDSTSRSWSLSAASDSVEVSGSVNVNLVGDSVGIGGGTEYITDAVASLTPTGTVFLAVRNDATATLVSDDGDYSPLQVDGNGRLVTIELNSPTIAAYTEFIYNLLAPTINTIGAAFPSAILVMGLQDASGLSRGLRGQSVFSDAYPSPSGGNVLQVASYPYFYNGTTWDRFHGDSASGLLVNLGSNNDITGSVTANAGTNLNTSSLALEAGGNLAVIAGWDNGVGDGASVTGDVSHDSPDAGEPVKIGGFSVDYSPSSNGAKGQTAVGAGDRVNLALNTKGELVPVHRVERYALPDLDLVYDDSPTSGVSAAIVTSHASRATLYGAFSKTSSPTNILVTVEGSPDGFNWFPNNQGELAGAIIPASAITGSYMYRVGFEVNDYQSRVILTCTGTDSTNKFTASGVTLLVGT